jgi:hypothetical protein
MPSSWLSGARATCKPGPAYHHERDSEAQLTSGIVALGRQSLVGEPDSLATPPVVDRTLR